MLEAFRLTKVGTSDVSKKPALRCFSLNGSGSLVTGDGSQFAKYEGVSLPGHTDSEALILVRAKLILEEIKLLADVGVAEDCEVAVSEQWLSFRSVSSNVEVTFQQHNGDAIDLERIFQAVKDKVDQSKEENKVTTVEVALSKLRNVLQLSVLYEEQALINAYPAYTQLKVNKEGLLFEIQIEDLSKNSEQIEVESYEGPGFEVKFLASKLKEIINEIKGDRVIFTFFSQNDPFIVESPDYPQFVYLQSP